MWIDNVEQLQNMNTNLAGNYALHGNIDALNTNASIGNAFTAIGDENNAFTGNLDGLMWKEAGITYGIFDLNVTGKDKIVIMLVYLVLPMELVLKIYY